MLIILSPAKIQNFKSEKVISDYTMPDFLDEAEDLVNQVRQLSVSALAELLGINTNLAMTNAERFATWHRPFTPDNAKQAVLVFNGEVFHGLDVRSLQKDQLAYLQDHLRLFSGLYGILRPFDLIQPYRLDVSDKLSNDSGEDLYGYWRQKVTSKINEAIANTGKPEVLLNLTSGEYIKCLDRKAINARIIDVDFHEETPGGYKTIVVYTKKARGMLTRFVIENGIDDPEYLKAFDYEGYYFNRNLSKKNRFVFTR
jgi:cytoplasmic iron level regulating protein YaaA (DUF328/UPF0246 family)